jgi:hypothetical protein
MAEVSMTTAHMQAEQVSTAIMAQNMSQAAGVASIATPVSMNLLHLIVLDHNCVSGCCQLLNQGKRSASVMHAISVTTACKQLHAHHNSR